jgi:diguanylate cyclase (GGDEF)-like protein
MIQQLPNLWRIGLSALLAAETEQAALDAAVTTVAELLGGPAVGVLKGRSEHLSSVSSQGQERFLAPLFVEALWGMDARLVAGHLRHKALLDERRVVTVHLREEDTTLGMICAVTGEGGVVAESAYVAIVELAFIRTVQRIRRLSETHLLHEISLRLGNTLDLSALLHEVLALTARTFAARSSRIFLYDERMDDLVVTLGPNERGGATHRLTTDGTIAGWVIREGMPMVRNVYAPGGPVVCVAEDSTFRCKLICVPLKYSDRTLGALMLMNSHDGPDFLDEDLRLLTTIAGTVGMLIANARLYQRAIRDALTGAYNRGAFDNTLQELWQRSQTSGEGFSLILLDLDNFKQVNDRFGHSIGDTVLQMATCLLREALREEDCIFRYGGEEFGVLLSGVIDPMVVVAVAERLRVALDRELTINNLVRVQISASLGIALHPLHGASSPRALLDIADDAAYQAKREGKNRAVLAPLPSEAI